jgi:hypothetical protein
MTMTSTATPVAVEPPPIRIGRGGVRFPQDFPSRTNAAWVAAWGALNRADAWHDAAELIAHIAAEAEVESSTARNLLTQAVNNGVLTVRYRLRGEPRRRRAEYRIRPISAAAHEQTAAGLVERFLRSRGRRGPLHPVADLATFHDWLGNVREGANWLRAREGAGQDTDTDLLAALRRKHPFLVDDPRGPRDLLDFPDPEPRDLDRPSLVGDPARPTPAEMTAIKAHALRLVGAVAMENWAEAYHLRPRSVTDAGYLVTSLAELVGDAVHSAGLDVGAWVEVKRPRFGAASL